MQIILFSAAPGRRIKSQGAISLLQINKEETLIEHQIKTLRNIFPTEPIYIVVGYRMDNVVQKIKNYHNCRYIYNEDYETTNIIGSLEKVIKNIYHDNEYLLIHGDTYFNEYAIPKKRNSISLCDNLKPYSAEIGLQCFNNKLNMFMFDMGNTWSKLLRIDNSILDIISPYCLNETYHQYFLWEIFNDYILDQLAEDDIRINVENHQKSLSIDIDSVNDFKIVQGLYRI